MRKTCFCTLILIVTAFTVFAQSGYRNRLQDFYYKRSIDGRRPWQRISLAFGKHFMPGTIDLKYTGYPNDNFYDTSFSFNIKSKRSYAVNVGTYFPIAIVSDVSMLVLNVELMASTTSLGYDSVKFTDTAKFMRSFETSRAGLPISLEYRLGGDVVLNKNYKGLFTLGVGLMPCINSSDDYDKVPPYKILPFVKAELGFFALVAIKLRATAYLGNTDYLAGSTMYNVVPGGKGDELRASARGSNGFTLSAVIMPFSVSWNTDKL